MERSARNRDEAFVELDRVVVGTSWGVAIATEPKQRNRNKWAAIRSREQRASGVQPKASGEALERSITALAMAHPEYIVMGAAS